MGALVAEDSQAFNDGDRRAYTRHFDTHTPGLFRLLQENRKHLGYVQLPAAKTVGAMLLPQADEGVPSMTKKFTREQRAKMLVARGVERMHRLCGEHMELVKAYEGVSSQVLMHKVRAVRADGKMPCVVDTSERVAMPRATGAAQQLRELGAARILIVQPDTVDVESAQGTYKPLAEKLGAYSKAHFFLGIFFLRPDKLGMLGQAIRTGTNEALKELGVAEVYR